MKSETFIIIVKGFVCIGAATISALVGSLAQWSNDTATPSKVQWIIIIGTAASAGFTALGGFMSSAFGRYVEARTNGNGAAAAPEPKPVTPQP